jgi:hypothetical protein
MPLSHRHCSSLVLAALLIGAAGCDPGMDLTAPDLRLTFIPPSATVTTGDTLSVTLSIGGWDGVAFVSWTAADPSVVAIEQGADTTRRVTGGDRVRVRGLKAGTTRLDVRVTAGGITVPAIVPVRATE